jgi:hypothetical protein
MRPPPLGLRGGDMKERRRRRIPADVAARAALGEVSLRGFYSRIPEPETTWEKCASCGAPARILSREHKECIRCQVQRAKQARAASGPF